MKFFNKLPIALIGTVAIIAIVQPNAVFARYAQFPSASVVAEAKAKDLVIQGEEKYQKGDYQGAIEAFNQAIVLDPNYAEAYSNRGVARRALGDNQGATADYNEALRINPNLAIAYSNRGNVRRQLGDKQGIELAIKKPLTILGNFNN